MPLRKNFSFFIVEDKVSGEQKRTEMFEPMFSKPEARKSLEYYWKQKHKLIFRVTIKGVKP